MKELTIDIVICGELEVNCYVITTDEFAFIIDPGGDPELIETYIYNKKLLYILLTHGHVDHIGAVEYFYKKYNPQIMASILEKKLLSAPMLNLSLFFSKPMKINYVSKFLEDNEEIDFDGYKIKAISTPGHTPGGMCYLLGNNLFTGDTLFKMSVGRTDFPGSNHKELIKNIKNKLFTLDENIVIFPGHLESSTIGQEKLNNPFTV